jgi:2-methylcitrate dehydratase PrpD
LPSSDVLDAPACGAAEVEAACCAKASGINTRQKIKSVKIDFTVEVSPRAAIIENGIAIRH